MILPANTTQPTVQSLSPLQQLAQYFQQAGVSPASGLGAGAGGAAQTRLQQRPGGALSAEPGDGDQSMAYLNAILGGQQASGLGGQLLGSFGQPAQGPNMNGSAGTSIDGSGFLGMLGSLFDG